MAVKLLILEDSELDAELMFREIKQMEQEFSTKLVSTKNDFEQSLINWHPDIVISDFDLQTFSGDETLILAKNLKPGIPVIILSGGISKEQEVYLLENRANDVLTKDNLKRLPFVINRLLNEKRDKEKLNNTLYELAGNLEFQEALAEISLGFNSFLAGNKGIILLFSAVCSSFEPCTPSFNTISNNLETRSLGL